jgi:hypothetical protein
MGNGSLSWKTRGVSQSCFRTILRLDFEKLKHNVEYNFLLIHEFLKNMNLLLVHLLTVFWRGVIFRCILSRTTWRVRNYFNTSLTGQHAMTSESHSTIVNDNLQCNFLLNIVHVISYGNVPWFHSNARQFYLSRMSAATQWFVCLIIWIWCVHHYENGALPTPNTNVLSFCQISVYINYLLTESEVFAVKY